MDFIKTNAELLPNNNSFLLLRTWLSTNTSFNYLTLSASANFISGKNKPVNLINLLYLYRIQIWTNIIKYFYI